jgi:hypothetical protein
LDVYAEVYAKEITTDPFFSLERFAERLNGHSSRSGWACVVGEVEGDVVGYAYGFREPATYAYGGRARPSIRTC